MSTQTQRFLTDVAELEMALVHGQKYLDPHVVTQMEQILTSARKRISLGVNHTVVALAGGTGSGKSSTFNAISGLDFADVGVRRPTTARVASCTWSSDAKELLDWIGVDLDRRISRDTALDGEEEKALRGLILLDLPDHDSVALHHKEIVDKALPLVDVLIWILDPQKYADQALHAGYLKQMVDAQASMIVVLNQMDTVGEREKATLISDVQKVLGRDGLGSLTVRPISARTHEGIPELKAELQAAVERQSMASRRLGDELIRMAKLLESQAPISVETNPKTLIENESQRYFVAGGVPAVCDEVSERTARADSVANPPSVRAPNESSVSGARSRWLDRVTQNMTPRFAAAMREHAGSASNLTEALNEAASDIEVPWGQVPGTSRTPEVLSFVVAALLAVLAVFGFASSTFTIPISILIGLGVIVCIGVGFLLRSQRHAKLLRAGRTRSENMRQDVHDAFESTLSSVLVEPLKPILEAHNAISSAAIKVISRSQSASKN